MEKGKANFQKDLGGKGKDKTKVFRPGFYY
jgi:hypothetical protein